MMSPHRFMAREMKYRPTAAVLLVRVLGALALGSYSSIALAADCGASPKPGVDWSGCSKRNILLGGSNLGGAQLVATDLTSTDLRGADLSRANLSNAMLVRTSLKGATAVGAVFEKAIGQRTSFVDAQLARASFAKAEMQRADFTGANLSGAEFDSAGIGRAKFSRANLAGVNFRFANLARADFRNAEAGRVIDVTGAYMFRTRLEGFDLSKANGLASWQIDMACGDDRTLLPPGITAPLHWPCPEE